MKKSGIVAMLLISLMMAMGAAALAMNWLQERIGEADGDPEQPSVVVAAMQIPFGQTVQAADLRTMELPPHAIPGGSFNSIDDVVGRVASQTIYADEIILEKRVVDHLGGSDLAAVLEHGRRAITVRVDDVLGVAGFLLPGNRVDVVSSQRAGSNREVRSETILTDIKVLAVDQLATPERDSPVIVRAVTLEVTPSQAERVVKATEEGRVQLTLRNPLDNGQQDNQETAAVDPEPEVRPAPARARPVPPRPRNLNVTVIRGTDASTTTVKE